MKCARLGSACFGLQVVFGANLGGRMALSGVRAAAIFAGGSRFASRYRFKTCARLLTGAGSRFIASKSLFGAGF